MHTASKSYKKFLCPQNQIVIKRLEKFSLKGISRILLKIKLINYVEFSKVQQCYFNTNGNVGLVSTGGNIWHT